MDKENLIKTIMGTELIEIFEEDWLRKNISTDHEKNHPLSLLLFYESETVKNIIYGLNKNFLVVKAILDKDFLGKEKLARIVGRLRHKERFNSCLPELEWVYFLNNLIKDVIIEPTHPEKGHDIEAKIINRNVAFEILSIEESNGEKEIKNKRNELMKSIRKIHSSYHVSIRLDPQTQLCDVQIVKKK